MEIEIKNIPQFRVASVPMKDILLSAAAVTECGAGGGFGRSLPLAQGESRPHGVKGMALYDPQTLAGKQCIPVSQGILPEREIAAHEETLKKHVLGAMVEFTPSGCYAVAVFKGPYSGLRQATMDAENAVAGRKLRRAEGPIMELYMNDSSDTPPDELVTQICIPLADE